MGCSEWPKCEITHGEGDHQETPPRIKYCPLHQAAPETAQQRDDLLAALIAIQGDVDMSSRSYIRAWNIAEAALSRAEPQQPDPQEQAAADACDDCAQPVDSPLGCENPLCPSNVDAATAAVEARRDICEGTTL